MKEQDGQPTFIYIGNDTTHWEDLAQDFRESYPSLNFKSQHFYETDPKKIQSLFVEIYQMKPKAIFIDFTRNFHEHLHLARLLSRTNTDFNFFLCGLIEGSEHQEVLKKSLLTGISSLFVKTSENDSLIYSCMCMAFPGLVQGHGFATANLSDEAQIYLPARASILDKNSIHIESNEKLEVGEEVYLHSFWSEKKILQTSLCKLNTQKEDNLFYPFLYSQKLNFLFSPKFESLEGWDDKTKALKKAEFDDNLKRTKLRMEDWIENNKSLSHPKQTKSLIIDKSFHFYDNQERTDSYPFVVRCQPFLKDVKNEVIKNYADLIIYQFDNLPEEIEILDPEEVAKESKVLKKGEENTPVYLNDLDNLIDLVNVIKTLPNYNPFIIVFNTKVISTEEFKKKTGFEHIIINGSQILPDLILKMAEILNKKLQLKVEKQAQNQVYLDKKNDQTYVEIERNIKVLKISENDLYFTSETKLPHCTPLRLTYPVDLLLTIVDPPKHITETGGYYAIINGLGESEKMELRKFINSVFFRQRDEQKRIEKEAFLNLNKKVQDEKNKKAQEEALKQAETQDSSDEEE